MRAFLRSAKIGAAAGLAIGAIAIVAAWAVATQMNAGRIADPVRVVVVFAIAGEAGQPVAHTVVVARPGSRDDFYTADTDAIVDIPGVSSSKLSMAYAYAGAKGVAQALDGERRRGTAWVDVPPAAYERLMSAGVEVTLRDGFDVFDGTRVIGYEAGRQRVAAQDLRGLLNGMAYLPVAERLELRERIAEASLAALRRQGEAPPTGVTTNLTGDAWTAFARGSTDAGAPTDRESDE